MLPDLISDYLQIKQHVIDPEINQYISMVEKSFRNGQIDRFSCHELIFLSRSGIYPIECLERWLVESICNPGEYLLPATQIKALDGKENS